MREAKQTLWLAVVAAGIVILGARPADAENCLGPFPVEGRVLALDSKTGQVTVVYKGKGERLSDPAVAAGVLYVGSANELKAVPLPGALAKPWSFLADYAVYDIKPTPQAILFSAGSTLYSLQPATGQENWRFASDRAISELMLAEGLVVFGGHFGVRAVHGQTGKLAWFLPAPWNELSLGGKGTVCSWGLEKTFVGDLKKGEWLWKDDTPGNPVALDRSPVNAVAGGGRLYYLAGLDAAKGRVTLAAMDVTTRQPLWDTTLDAKLGKLAFLYVNGGQLLLTSEGDDTGPSGVFVLDAATGKRQWHFTAGAPVWRFTRPAGDATAVYLSDGTRTVWAVERGTGKLRWKHVLPAAPAKHSYKVLDPAVGPDAVYVTVNELTSQPLPK